MHAAKIYNQIKVAIEQGNDAVVLGALGCGAFNNDPIKMAELYRDILSLDEFRGKIKVEFAITGSALQQKFANVFKEQLKSDPKKDSFIKAKIQAVSEFENLPEAKQIYTELIRLNNLILPNPQAANADDVYKRDAILEYYAHVREEFFKAKFPFTFFYQKLKDSLTNIDASEVFFEIELNCDVGTEFEKFKSMEKALLNSYFRIRNKQWPLGSRLGDTLEVFIKSSTGLNLIEKYEIKVPHSVKANKKIDIDQLLDKDNTKPKRIALVSPNAIEFADGRNDKLIRKLKAEYDEVVLISSQTYDKNAMTSLKNELESQGISVSLSTATLNAIPDANNVNKTLNIISRNLDARIEFSVFATHEDTLKRYAQLIPTRERVNKTICYKIMGFSNAETTCRRFDPKKVEHDIKEDTYQELESALRKYINHRKLEKSLQNSSFHSFFGRLTGMSANVKIAAAEKLIQAIKHDNEEPNIKKPHFNLDQIYALRADKGSRLTQLIKMYEEKLPKSFIDEEVRINTELSKNLGSRAW
jgi:hypothetical protein